MFDLREVSRELCPVSVINIPRSGNALQRANSSTQVFQYGACQVRGCNGCSKQNEANEQFSFVGPGRGKRCYGAYPKHNGAGKNRHQHIKHGVAPVLIDELLQEFSGLSGYPQLFLDGNLVGGYAAIARAIEDGTLSRWIEQRCRAEEVVIP